MSVGCIVVPSRPDAYGFHPARANQFFNGADLVEVLLNPHVHRQRTGQHFRPLDRAVLVDLRESKGLVRVDNAMPRVAQPLEKASRLLVEVDAVQTRLDQLK
jgi:hypothetical protein